MLCRLFSTKRDKIIPIIYENADILVKSLPVTSLGMNQYMIGCKKTKQAAILDCGDKVPQNWVDSASKNGMVITKILQTHGHIDHVCGLHATKELLPNAPIYYHPDDWIVCFNIDKTHFFNHSFIIY